ncbi:stage II sporulation protein M [Aeribacillus sp. FSL M8-0254]|uniref:stage II sporulation protein M n=1 Tax=Aeribacillus sp. FSL M8-0254 TaxID=2954577 RepID=UPI0030F89F91
MNFQGRGIKDVVRKLVSNNKILFVISLLLFFGGMAGGYLFRIDAVRGDLNYIQADVEDLLFNNIKASLVIASGLLSLGIPTVIFLITNGLIVGSSIQQQLELGLSISSIFVKLIPHGIFEIPAILISGIIGLKGVSIIIEYFRTSLSAKQLIKQTLFEIALLTSIILIFLTLAAIIEWYITPL